MYLREREFEMSKYMIKCDIGDDDGYICERKDYRIVERI